MAVARPSVCIIVRKSYAKPRKAYVPEGRFELSDLADGQLSLIRCGPSAQQESHGVDHQLVRTWMRNRIAGFPSRSVEIQVGHSLTEERSISA